MCCNEYAMRQKKKMTQDTLKNRSCRNTEIRQERFSLIWVQKMTVSDAKLPGRMVTLQNSDFGLTACYVRKRSMQWKHSSIIRSMMI